jgi:hypothetical protein
MALDLWVYGDESGKKEDRYSLVSAYIANQRTWDVLRKEWEPVIRSAGLTELHAEKVFTRKAAARGGSTSNPSASWSHDDALVFIAEIGRIIRRHRRSIRPIAVVVDGPDFRTLPRGERRALTSGHFKFWEHDQHRKWASDGKPSEPYMLAFQRVVQAALECARQTQRYISSSTSTRTLRSLRPA